MKFYLNKVFIKKLSGEIWNFVSNYNCLEGEINITLPVLMKSGNKFFSVHKTGGNFGNCILVLKKKLGPVFPSYLKFKKNQRKTFLDVFIYLL